MKKLVFLLPIAALAMASCSNDLVVEQPATKVVSAEALQVYPDLQGITRGTVWDNSNFTEFYLTTTGEFQTDAENPNSTEDNNKKTKFVNQIVSKNGSTWEIGAVTSPAVAAGTPWYWPSKNAESEFTAWAPVAPSGDPVFGPGNYTASTTIADQRDILVAFNKGKATDLESGVPLKFRHILSQIIIKADNAAKNTIKIDVKDVRLNNIISGGTWTAPTASTATELGYNPWTKGSATDNYLTGCGQATSITLDGSAKDLTGANPLLLIPQQLGAAKFNETDVTKTGQYLSVLVKITKVSGGDLIYPKNIGNNNHGGEYAWAAVDINTEWEPGKKYIYTLHFTENGYGKVDPNTEGGNDEPGSVDPDNPQPDDPQPGEDIVDTPVKLILDVEVIDWVDGTTDNESLNM